MRRFLTLVCLLCLAIPAGISISGCTRNPGANYCNGLGYGLKITDVDAITLQPQTTGISMAYGQTRQISSPSAVTCKGASASVGTFTYGTTNNQLVDISPSGNICAGTWNRNTGGGIANYTICNAPSPLPSTGGLPYTTAYVTASAASVTSNPVEVYVHAQVTSVTLVGPTQCLSQGVLGQLDAQACYASGSSQYLLCAPSTVTSANYACPLANGVSSVPSCTNAIGTLSYSVGNSSIASINSETNQITASMPGTTVITASVANSGSSAGYFSTCPPASIKVSLANGATSGTVSQGVTQNLTTTVTDTTGATISGLSLDYQSTNPVDISSGSGGAISTNFPGQASIYAVCQPGSCNPSPINQIGVNGTGLSLTSNPVTVITPGTASQYVWFGAPGQSQYFVSAELITGTIGTPVRLPYVPNSMVMDKSGNNLYFGSTHELMVYSAVSNTLSKQDPSSPGVVLAVAPDDSQLLINDQVRGLFYLYNASSGAYASFGGMGTSAAWTPDVKTLYVTDSAAVNCTPVNPTVANPVITGHTDTMYVYNVNTGWTSYPLPASTGTCKSTPVGVQNLAITTPSVGAFASGASTVDHTWCPTGTVANNASTITAFYPQVDSVAAQTDILAATTDGQHILGAAVTGTGVTLSDIGVAIPNTACTSSTTAGMQTLKPLSLSPAFTAPLAVTLNSTPANTVLNQVLTSPSSSLAFLTYTNNGTTTGATMPYYVPGNGMKYLPLTGSSAITAPLAGAFSPDNTLFFVSTAGDNKVHYISVPLVTSSPATADTQQITPALPACTLVANGGVDPGCVYTGTSGGAAVPATVIYVKPRATT